MNEWDGRARKPSLPGLLAPSQVPCSLQDSRLGPPRRV